MSEEEQGIEAGRGGGDGVAAGHKTDKTDMHRHRHMHTYTHVQHTRTQTYTPCTHLWVCCCRAPWSFHRVAAPTRSTAKAIIVRPFRGHGTRHPSPVPAVRGRGRGNWSEARLALCKKKQKNKSNQKSKSNLWREAAAGGAVGCVARDQLVGECVVFLPKKICRYPPPPLPPPHPRPCPRPLCPTR